MLINIAISRNALDTLHLASPVLKRRRKIDANYWKVVSNWGGGYPWPYSEFIYHTQYQRRIVKQDQNKFIEMGEDFDTYDLWRRKFEYMYSFDPYVWAVYYY